MSDKYLENNDNHSYYWRCSLFTSPKLFHHEANVHIPHFLYAGWLAGWLGLLMASMLSTQPALAQNIDSNSTPPNNEGVGMRAVCQGGTVQVWGRNQFGQLGLGYTSPNNTPVGPTIVPGLSNVVDIAWGGAHTIALLADGTIRTWGQNSTGQLGLGATNTTNYNSPQIVNISCVTAVFAGQDYSMALKSDGTLWAWGNNFYGTLGIGSSTTAWTGEPQLVLTNAPVKKVVGSHVHCVALMASGRLMAWGLNGAGVFGNNTTEYAPHQVNMPMGITQAVDIATNGTSSGFIASNGQVYMWGGNAFGELGIGASIPSVMYTPAQTQLPAGSSATRMAMSSSSTLVTTTTGSTLTWGTNVVGFLGDPYCGTQGAMYDLPVPGPALTGVVDLCAPSEVCFAATLSNGQLLTWGSNNTGALGYSTAPANYSCIATPVALSCPVVPRQPVQLAPAMLAALATDVCQGQPITLTATGCGPFTWSPAADIVSTNGSSVVVTPLQTTTYSVSNGFGVPATVTLNVQNKCCLSEIVPIKDKLVSGTYFSYTFESGAYYLIPDNNTVVLQAGTFTLNSCTLLMGKDARLIVGNDAKLQLMGANVMAACTDMWHSITVQGDSRGIEVTANDSRRSYIQHGIEGIVVEEPTTGAQPPFVFSESDFRHNLQSISVTRALTAAQPADVISNCTFDSDPELFIGDYKATSPASYYYANRHVALNGDFSAIHLDKNDFRHSYFGVFLFDGTQSPSIVRLYKNTFHDFWLGGVYCMHDRGVNVISQISLEDNIFTFPAATELPPTPQTNDVLTTYTYGQLAETFGGYMRFGQLRALRNTFQQLDSAATLKMDDYDNFYKDRPRQTGIFGEELPLVLGNHFYLLDRGAEVTNVPLGSQTQMEGNSFINCHLGIRAGTAEYDPTNQPQLNASCNTFRRDDWRYGTSTGIELNLPNTVSSAGNPGGPPQLIWPQILVMDARTAANPNNPYPLRNLFDDGGTNSQPGYGDFVTLTNNSSPGSGQYTLDYLAPFDYYLAYDAWAGPLINVIQSFINVNPQQTTQGQRDTPCEVDGFPVGRGLQQRPVVSPSITNAASMLLQNAPNPCSGRTTLAYTLAPQTQQALLLIRRSTDGSQVQQIALPAGSTTQELDVRAYPPGVYFYTLVVDGLPCDTKRLLVR